MVAAVVLRQSVGFDLLPATIPDPHDHHPSKTLSHISWSTSVFFSPWDDFTNSVFFFQISHSLPKSKQPKYHFSFVYCSNITGYNLGFINKLPQISILHKIYLWSWNYINTSPRSFTRNLNSYLGKNGFFTHKFTMWPVLLNFPQLNMTEPSLSWNQNSCYYLHEIPTRLTFGHSLIKGKRVIRPSSQHPETNPPNPTLYNPVPIAVISRSTRE